MLVEEILMQEVTFEGTESDLATGRCIHMF